MAYDFNPFKKRIREIEEHLAKELSSIHTGSASIAILDGVSIESYGARLAISHVATVATEDPRTLRIVPWDKSNNKEIEKAINAANLGVSVSIDDAGLRVFFPPLTTERRVAYTKIAREKVEESRIEVKGDREKTKNDIITLAREGSLSEDEKTRAQGELQKIVDEANSALEMQGEKKEKEILG